MITKKKYHKVKEHCHCAGHDICKLSYKTPKRNPSNVSQWFYLLLSF